MQSIKNTGVAIMLLFLSYGVYQVIMKPMPDQQGNENIDFSVSDPLTENQFTEPVVTKPIKIDFGQTSASGIESDADSSTAKLPLQPVQPSTSRDTIPQQLLDLPQQIDKQISQNRSLDAAPDVFESNDFASDLNSRSPRQPQDNDFGSFEPRSELSDKIQPQSDPTENQIVDLPDPTFVNDQSQFESTPLPPQTDLESTNRSQQLLSDKAVVPVGAMTRVSPRDSIAPSLKTGQSQRPPLEQAWPKVKSLVESGNYKTALTDLSAYYRDQDLESNQKTQLLQWLDALAAKVIYSSEHHLRSMPYVIQPDDTIATLARDWQIPAQLIYNVNTDQIPDPSELTPGVEIKMIQGPFDAEIDSGNNVMTLFLEGMYAGRFSIGSKQLSTTGVSRIVDKSASDKTDRPYWIKLDNGISIYGSDSGALEFNEIALSPVEAEELFSILSATSSVRVMR